MLVRFTVKNLFSFKDQTEFNLFPNKTQRLNHHKVNRNGIDFLRFTAVYGANGSGKSNLIKAIALLESMVEDGKLVNKVDDLKFKLDKTNHDVPVSIGIEFYFDKKIYYYAITFEEGVILNEFLAESNKESDKLIFDRNHIEGVQSIKFYPEYYKNEKNKLFADVLSEKLVQPNELLLSFLSNKYKDDFPDAKNVFDWFDSYLVILKADAKPGGIAQILDIFPNIRDFANQLIPSLNTGISKIDVEKKKFEEFAGENDSKAIKRILDTFKKQPESLSALTHTETREEISLVYENNEVVAKRIVTGHLDNKGKDVNFNLGEESDGTRRLIEYIPAFEGIINNNKVYLVDEIERSIHPITIKEIITKISLDEQAKGQLIFTTHESNLLDQDILRPDEIWFAQKDFDGSSKIYSLSEFKIHNTIDIENGYLNGRYGGIPFLSNLKDLNWHKYDVPDSE